MTDPQIYWLFTLSLVGVSVYFGWILRDREVEILRARNDRLEESRSKWVHFSSMSDTVIANLKTEIIRLNHQLAKFHQYRAPNGKFTRKQ